MTSQIKASKKKFIIAGVVTGLMAAGIMALFDIYNKEPFSIWKFLMFFFVIGILNSYLKYRAVRNVEKNEAQKFNNR